MSTFHTLPPDTVGLIRSGQVISSIFCVVKELMENAIDAEASSIEIRLEDYGLELVEVKDNGTGVRKSDLELITAPYTTSKIATFDDLTSEKLKSYGFRGEALNSLCAVSEVEITTKTSQDAAGAVAIFDKNGKILNISNIAATLGTIVKVRKLFENVPVRRSYYESSKSRKEDDLKKIKHLIMGYALIIPQLRVVFHIGKKEVLRKLPCSNQSQSIGQVIGTDMLKQLKEIQIEVGDSELIGTMLVPSNDNLSMKLASKTSPEKTFFFVNKRLVIDKSLDRVIRKCFPLDRYPLAIVSIQVKPDLVDVNLEPSKMTVLIRCQKEFVITIENLLLTHYESKTSEEQQSNIPIIEPSKNINSKAPNANEILSEKSVVSTFEKIVENGSKSDLDLNFVSHSSKENYLVSNPTVSKEPPFPKSPITLQFPSTKAISDTSSRSTRNDPFDAEAFQHKEPIQMVADRNVREDKGLRTSETGQLKSSEISPFSFSKRSSNAAFSSMNENFEMENLSMNHQKKRVKYNDPSQPKIVDFISTKNDNAENVKIQNGDISSENPVVSWSRGNSVLDTQGEIICPVLIGNPNQLKEKIPKKDSRIRQPSIESEVMKESQSVKEKPTPEKTHPRFRTEHKISFDLKKIKDSTATMPSPTSKVQIIGQLNPSGFWMFQSNDGCINLLNHHRVIEVDIFKRLMKSQRLPSAPLARGPLELTGESKWTPSFSSTLKELSEVNQKSFSMSDPRLILNGIVIQARPEIDRYLLTGVASCVNFMGSDDVIEILKVISTKPNATIEECRPLKVKNYLMAESVRLMRQGSPQVDYETVENLLEIIDREKIEKCLHESCVYERLINIDELSQPAN